MIRMRSKLVIRFEYMFRKFKPSLLLVFLILSLLGCKKDVPRVKEGFLDLSNWNFQSDIIELNGDWEFYWNKIFKPDDFAREKIEPEYIKVPQAWAKTELNGAKLGRFGHATYRVRLKVPPGQYALYSKKIESAYTIWINGKKIASVGQVGEDRSSAKPQYSSTLGFIYNRDNFLDIVINVSNYRNFQSGIMRPIKFGDCKLIANHYLYSRSINFFIAAAFLIVSIYNFTIFIKRKNTKSSLYFAAFCLSFAAYILLVIEKVHVQIFPDIDFELNLKLLYFSFMFTPLLYLLYISELFALDTNRKIAWALALSTGLLAAIILIFKSYIYVGLTSIIYALLIFSAMFCCYILVRAIKNKREGAIAQAVPCFIFFGTAVNDILYSSSIINTTRLIPFGIMIFVVWQFVYMANRFAFLLNKTELLSQSHKDANIKFATLLEESNIELAKIFSHLDNLLYIESNSNYCLIYTNGDAANQPIELEMPIGKIPRAIKNKQIIDVHRRYLLSLDKIKRIVKVADNKFEALLQGTDTTVPVSRQKISYLRKTYPNLFK